MLEALNIYWPAVMGCVFMLLAIGLTLYTAWTLDRRSRSQEGQAREILSLSKVILKIADDGIEAEALAGDQTDVGPLSQRGVLIQFPRRST